MSAGKMIRALWQASDPRQITDDQLRELCQSEELALHLDNIAMIMDRLAVFKANDVHAGGLEDKGDVSRLLWGLSSTIEAIAAAVHVSGDAEAVLAGRLVQ